MTEIKCDYCGDMYAPLDAQDAAEAAESEEAALCYECLWDMFAKALDRAVRSGEFND